MQTATAQDFQVIESVPASGDSSVAMEAVVTFTFSAPVDTSADFGGDRPLSFYSIEPRQGITTDTSYWSDDLTQVRFDVVHQDTADYVWILSNARSQEGADLCSPYVLYYTTRTDRGNGVVTGYAYNMIAVKRGQCGYGFVALLDAYPDSSAQIAAAAAVGGDAEFEMMGIRAGTYWPVFLFDWNNDGEIRPDWSRIGDVTAEVGFYSRVGHNYEDGNPDSIVVTDSSRFEIEVGAIGGAVGRIELPGTARLLQNYPNPFDQSTTLAFELERPLRLRVSIHDVLGRRVGVPAAGFFATGRHEIAWTPQTLASGLYIVRLEAERFTLSRPMIFSGR